MGNDEGIGLLKRNRHLEKRVSDIDETLLSLKGHVEDQQRQIQHQSQQIQQQGQQIQHHGQEIEYLRLFSVGARKIRSRFLENEKRRYEKTSAPHRHIVENGNAFAHEPESLLDAYLYVDRERTDTHTYIRIYGIHPKRVVAACKFIPHRKVFGFHAHQDR